MSLSNKSESSSESMSRLSRWFSMRRGSYNNYDLITTSSNISPRFWTHGNDEHKLNTTLALLEESESIVTNSKNEEDSSSSQARTRIFPLALCPVPPDGLNPSELKKRYIISAILQSENSYILSMQRLVNDYKKPLEDSNPSILNSSKLATLFHCIPDILNCHLLLRTNLLRFIRNWDKEGKIGDAFLSTFSKMDVLEAYSGFINNFTNAMDLAKTETKRKSAFADFLAVKLICSHDRLSFFGLMVKPVQRIPQFILFLQDLLKYTPSTHEDRMSLQMALTQMECLADSLNERKRESEQFQAYKAMLQQISGPFSSLFLSSDQRSKYLLREDNVIQLEFNNNDGQLQKSKPRRLFLANDKVICVSVAPKQSHDFGATEKLTLKWTYQLNDVEMIDDSMSAKSFSRFVTSGSSKFNISGKGSYNISPNNQGEIESLANDLSNLMHDYNIMSRINDLVTQLKGNYRDINLNTTKNALNTIQTSIKKKDEEIAWMDSCCLQIILKNKSGKEEIVFFRTESPEIKREWITELRLAQLALDPNNSPAWEFFDRETCRSSLSMPLFTKMQPVYKSTQHQTEICCGCYYPASLDSKQLKRTTFKNRHYVWICSIDGSDSHISILQHHPNQSKSLIEKVSSLHLPKTVITTIEHTKGRLLGSEEREHIWCGMTDMRILIFDAAKVENPREVKSVQLPDVPTKILFHVNSENVFVSLKNGYLILFYKESDHWNFDRTEQISLNTQKEISSMQSIKNYVYASSGNSIFVLDGYSGEIQKSYKVCDFDKEVNFMQHAGVGMWISLKRSSIIKLYHAESFKHLQDVNIGPHILRVTSSSSSTTLSNNAKSPSIYVTALQACKGLLWVGTNTGISCTIPLPRLEGVPLISGNVNISYHAHCGPVTFFLPLVSKLAIQTSGSGFQASTKTEAEGEQNGATPSKEQTFEVTSFTQVKPNHQSPVVLRKKSRCREIETRSDSIRKSKTLPRGFSGISSHLMRSSSSSGSSNGFDAGCDIFGMYSDLLYIKEDLVSGNNTMKSNNENTLDSLRRGNSDPDLSAIPFKIGTLDRRLKMKIGRPRSLDLSNWSVESRSSSVYTSSSESEDSMGTKFRSISRNSSSASHKFNGGDLMEIKENDAHVIIPLTTTPHIKEINPTTTEKSVLNMPATSTLRNNKRGGSRTNNHHTILMLMGGRGYVNWRNVFNSPSGQKHSRSNSLTTTNYKLLNSTDGNIIIWEKKI